jgi:hypothetical protein
MKTFNLIQRVILLTFAFILISFIPKENNSLSLDTKNKLQSIKTTTQSGSNAITLVYVEKTPNFQKAFIRQCISSNLNISIQNVTKCDISIDAEIIEFSGNVIFLPPTTGLTSTDPNEGKAYGSREISYTELQSAIAVCGSSILSLSLNNTCEDLDGLEY